MQIKCKSMEALFKLYLSDMSVSPDVLYSKCPIQIYSTEVTFCAFVQADHMTSGLFIWGEVFDILDVGWYQFSSSAIC